MKMQELSSDELCEISFALRDRIVKLKGQLNEWSELDAEVLTATRSALRDCEAAFEKIGIK